MKSDYLAYALLDATVDQFYPILETLGESMIFFKRKNWL
jgi:Mg2+ and Co2+ transporter CorA